MCRPKRLCGSILARTGRLISPPFTTIAFTIMSLLRISITMISSLNRRFAWSKVESKILNGKSILIQAAKSSIFKHLILMTQSWVQKTWTQHFRCRTLIKIRSLWLTTRYSRAQCSTIHSLTTDSNHLRTCFKTSTKMIKQMIFLWKWSQQLSVI